MYFPGVELSDNHDEEVQEDMHQDQPAQDSEDNPANSNEGPDIKKIEAVQPPELGVHPAARHLRRTALFSSGWVISGSARYFFFSQLIQRLTRV